MWLGRFVVVDAGVGFVEGWGGWFGVGDRVFGDVLGGTVGLGLGRHG